jgi:glycosyltransferase involved in cell wall biosynthesis
MKILIDIRLLSKGGQSGIEEYTRHLVSNLLAIDKKNSYQLFYNGWKKHPLPTTWPNKATIIDRKMPNKLFDLNSHFMKKSPLPPADLIFSPNLNLLKTKAPRILTIHDLSFIHYPHLFPRQSQIWHWLQDYKSQIKEASLITAVSNFTKQDLIETLKVPEEKIRVVPLGIDEKFKVLNVERPSSLQAPFILYLGTIEPRKNVAAIIKAFNIVKANGQLKDLKLVLAGRLGWLYKKTLKTYEASPYKEDIILWGSVEDKDRPLLYNLAEALIFPSFFEGFGLPPLEAQACGCPVIASRRTSLIEVLGDSARLIDPWRIHDLAGTIEEVLTTNLKNKLKEAGLINRQRFSWDKSAHQLLNIFNEYEA